MAKYAEIQDNVVINIFFPPQGFELEDCFHASLLHRFVEVEDENIIFAGYIYDPATGEFTAPTEPEPEPEAPSEPE
jgi:hypothetical protein